MYKPTKWLDHVEDVDTGEIVQEGTEKSAGNFNNMEYGISDAQIASAIMMIVMKQKT